MPRLLVVDAGSPVSSLALSDGEGDGERIRHRTFELQQASERLLPALAALLAEAALELRQLDGLVALSGPGSFTGLRIGLATVLGLHQASGLPATALPTATALAAAAAELDPADPRDVVAVVDALRGEWTAVRFAAGDPARPLGEARLVTAAELSAGGPARIVGFGVGRLAAEPGWPRQATLVEPPPLAPAALRWIARQGLDWDPDRLTAPLYARPPAVTAPAKPKLAAPWAVVAAPP